MKQWYALYVFLYFYVYIFVSVQRDRRDSESLYVSRELNLFFLQYFLILWNIKISKALLNTARGSLYSLAGYHKRGYSRVINCKNRTHI